MTRREAAEEAVGGTWMKMGSAMILDVPGDGIAAICASHGWAVVGGSSGPETGLLGGPVVAALYAVGTERPDLRWGPTPPGARLDPGYHSAEERAQARAEGRLRRSGRRLTARECKATPEPFRDLLISLARSAARAAEEE